MAQSPQVSVIIPTCGRPGLLLQCVDSILKGSYESFEILVIDQNANQTLKQSLVQQFLNETRLKYFFLDKAGASRARNFGVKKAKGEIVAFIDDDAVADPGWLSAIADTFSTVRPIPALIGGCIKPLWPQARPNWYPTEREYLLGLYNIGDELCPLPEHDQPIAVNMAGLREVIIALGGFDEHLGPNYFRKHPMITGEDAILGQRARRAGYELYYQPKAKVYHQISKAKLTRSHFLRRHFWEGVTIITQMHLLGDLESEKGKLILYHLAMIVKSLGLFLFPGFQNKFQLAARMLALSKVVYSAGVLYALLTLDTSVRA
jgi:GT2 family glycosyltransferase